MFCSFQRFFFLMASRAVLLLLLLSGTFALATSADAFSSEVEDFEDPIPSGSTSDDDYSHLQLETLSREEKIATFEEELAHVRQAAIQPALNHVLKRQHQVGAMRSNMPWYPSSAQKQQLNAAEQELRTAELQLQRAQSKEVAVLQQLKPLYGLVSYEFVAEQRQSISGSLKKVNDMAYNTAWYSSLFDLGRRQSLTDVIVGFFVQWVVSYLLMYPFAVVYYALWVLPWSIYDYSSSFLDVFTGSLLYVLWIAIMLSPFFGLYFGGRWVFAKYGPALRQMAEENQRRREQQRAAQFQRMQQPNPYGQQNPYARQNPYAQQNPYGRNEY